MFYKLAAPYSILHGGAMEKFRKYIYSERHVIGNVLEGSSLAAAASNDKENEDFRCFTRKLFAATHQRGMSESSDEQFSHDFEAPKEFFPTRGKKFTHENSW